MNTPPRATALVLLAASLAPRAVAGDAPAPAPPIEAIRREVDSGRRRLRSLHVESITRSTGAASTSGSPLETRHVLAAKGPLRYAELAHRVPPLDWSEDIGFTRSYFTGATFDALWVLNRYYETLRVVPGEFPSTKVRAEFYIECTGWWPPDDASVPDGLEPTTLLHLALAAPSCRVRPRTEEVGGVPCVVAEVAGRDLLWLDPSRGFAIVRREFAGPSVRIVYENSDFREAGPGIWLPWRLRRVVTPGANHAEGPAREVVISDADRTVSLLRVNDVDDGTFTFRPAPGTLIHDLDRKTVRQVPGGLDLLDDVARAGRKLLPPAGRASGEAPAGPPPILAWSLAAASIPALVSMGRRRFSWAAPGVSSPAPSVGH